MTQKLKAIFMKQITSSTFIACFALSGILLARSSEAQVINVPATADLQLSGWPDGTQAWWDDIAPAESPVLVTNIQISSGQVLSFAVEGSAARDWAGPFVSADGYYGSDWDYVVPPTNGISGMVAPTMALLGVFLGDSMPDTNSTPPNLSFSTSSSQDYTLFTPLLRQQFFIGNGRTSDGSIQGVVVPEGATRLFLGISDTGHNNNLGNFSVTITLKPRVTFVKAFTVDFSDLAVGSNYQLQASTDLATWTNFGEAFIATSQSYTNTAYQRIDDWGKLFFRLQTIP